VPRVDSGVGLHAGAPAGEEAREAPAGAGPEGPDFCLDAAAIDLSGISGYREGRESPAGGAAAEGPDAQLFDELVRAMAEYQEFRGERGDGAV